MALNGLTPTLKEAENNEDVGICFGRRAKK
jgi:hypothetical protein